LSLITRSHGESERQVQTNAIDRLASSVNRGDEVPNARLAESIVKKDDEEAILDLIRNLANKDQEIQSDCIEVLYEVGERKPAMIAESLKSSAPSSKARTTEWRGER
jgi:hypothetical protein